MKGEETVTEKLLFLKDAEGVNLYFYFEAAVYPEQATGILPPLPMGEDVSYYLPLPVPLVSPRVYLGKARLAAALGMEADTFAALCRTSHSIVTDPSDVLEYPTEVFRDDLILKSSAGGGLRGVDALRYLCERYLEGLSLREDAVISAVRVDAATAMALAEKKKEALNTPFGRVYVKAFCRVARLLLLCIRNAPDLILRNEIMLLHRTLESLCKVAPFALE